MALTINQNFPIFSCPYVDLNIGSASDFVKLRLALQNLHHWIRIALESTKKFSFFQINAPKQFNWFSLHKVSEVCGLYLNNLLDIQGVFSQNWWFAINHIVTLSLLSQSEIDTGKKNWISRYDKETRFQEISLDLREKAARFGISKCGQVLWFGRWWTG